MLIPLSELAPRHGIKIDRVVHAGAHFAEEAAAYAGASVADVLWVEGNPDLIERIREAVAPYGHKVAQALLGAESGRSVTFHVSNFDSMSSSVLDLGTHAEKHPQVVYVGDRAQTLSTLDDVAAQFGFLDADFLNLDLQGYELECLKGAGRLLESIRTIYTEINVDELYRGCALLPELDGWLNARGFEAVDVLLAGSSRRAGDEFVGWGDACYVRVDQPRPFSVMHPADALDWFEASAPPSGGG
ncbi:MAG: hypothetical protein QOK05_839 [Chloroflexota bacterium]|jgi:FkbM family methyltransferase|nr:hypothetical protein [Chloroflexota bacterium]